MTNKILIDFLMFPEVLLVLCDNIELLLLIKHERLMTFLRNVQLLGTGAHAKLSIADFSLLSLESISSWLMNVERNLISITAKDLLQFLHKSRSKSVNLSSQRLGLLGMFRLGLILLSFVAANALPRDPVDVLGYPLYKLNKDPFIVGGSVAAPTQFPYQVRFDPKDLIT